jgi:phytoene dehydrogenase-like protein
LVPGLVHDECAAFHPLAAASPTYRELGLERHGLSWLHPPIQCAHPLDDGSTAELHQSVQTTAERLGDSRWDSLFRYVSNHFEKLLADVSQPVLRVPHHPFLLARFGSQSILPATALAVPFRSAAAKALWLGVAAHALYPLTTIFSSAVGMSLVAAAHAEGWPVARGGSQSIVNALLAVIRANGGKLESGQRVTSIKDLPPTDIVMLDVSPRIAADILGDKLPSRVASSYRGYRHGSGAFKVDFAVDGGVPWKAESAKLAGTVHVGGDAAEIVSGEALIHRGRMPERPFVLVGQQYVADASRAAGSVKPVWSYAHVPHGFTGDATESIITQIERFAPGFRERIVGMAVRTTTEMSSYNPNYVGGDIIGGQSSPRQLVLRPRTTLNPYFTGVKGVYLCSASTPPGAGAHGLCGGNAAARALAAL